MRPTLRFTLAVVLTGAYEAFALQVSHVWRGELEAAIGPVMAWVIPIFMAYIPAIVIGFMCFTLILTPLPNRRCCGRPTAPGHLASGRR